MSHRGLGSLQRPLFCEAAPNKCETELPRPELVRGFEHGYVPLEVLFVSGSLALTDPISRHLLCCLSSGSEGRSPGGPGVAVLSPLPQESPLQGNLPSPHCPHWAGPHLPFTCSGQCAPKALLPGRGLGVHGKLSSWRELQPWEQKAPPRLGKFPEHPPLPGPPWVPPLLGLDAFQALQGRAGKSHRTWV